MRIGNVWVNGVCRLGAHASQKWSQVFLLRWKMQLLFEISSLLRLNPHEKR